MPQSPRLSALALTVALAATVLTTLAVLSLYAWRFGKATDKPLPVSVESGMFAVPTVDGKLAVLTPAIRLRNLSDSPIPNLSISINSEFLLYRDSPLGASAELVLPLEVFKTKASHPFRPQSMTVRKISVYGQLPSRARGVIDYEPRLSSQ